MRISAYRLHIAAALRLPNIAYILLQRFGKLYMLIYHLISASLSLYSLAFQVVRDTETERHGDTETIGLQKSHSY